MRARSFFYAGIVASLAACSGANADPAAAPATPITNDAGTRAPETSAEPVESETCAAERVALQAKLDASHRATTGAVLALKTPGCGVRILTSAPEKLALDADKLQRVGSITKTYVAALTLTLAHEGALSLDDTLANHLPDTALPHAESITIRQLLNHTSGVANYTDTKTFAEAQAAPAHAVAPRELVAMAASGTPTFEPGQGWHYSNTNYVLLGMIAEQVTGAKLATLLRTRVFEPASLKQTFLDGDEPVEGVIATGLDASGRALTDVFDLSLVWAAGAIVASPRDIVAWIEALGAGTFLDPEAQKQLTTATKTDSPSIDYGLGVFLFHPKVTGMGPGIGHMGDIPGYHSEALYLPQPKITLVAVVDSDRDKANDVIVGALEVLDPK